MTDRPRVRFAPSPTGYLHVGGARTALFNWLYARSAGGVFVLRVEDTDRERSRPELTQAILDGLSWLGLDWDEGPYHQADNLARHRADVARLADAGAAYRCFCPPERLDELRRRAKQSGAAAAYDRRCRDLAPEDSERRAAAAEPYTVRFRIPGGATVWNDRVAGETRFQNRDIEDFILLRSDATPTYNLAVVSDDIAMAITHVIRGADHISNTPKQIQIYRALGHEPPVFCHVPLILGPDGARLSKRHGATSLGEYLAAGFLPQAMINFLALLGWSPGDDREVMERGELIERFSLERINKKPAVFDHDKLAWLNGEYLSRAAPADLAAWAAPLLAERGLARAGGPAELSDWLPRVLGLLQGRAKTLPELVDRARPFFTGRVEPDPEAAAKHWKDRAATRERLTRLGARLEKLDAWDEASLERELRSLAEELEVGAGKLIHPLRVALTGVAVSPGIFELMNLMGRELVLARIGDALAGLGTP